LQSVDDSIGDGLWGSERCKGRGEVGIDGDGQAATEAGEGAGGDDPVAGKLKMA